jgi:hypothetical protein
MLDGCSVSDASHKGINTIKSCPWDLRLILSDRVAYQPDNFRSKIKSITFFSLVTAPFLNILVPNQNRPLLFSLDLLQNRTKENSFSIKKMEKKVPDKHRNKNNTKRVPFSALVTPS